VRPERAAVGGCAAVFLHKKDAEDIGEVDIRTAKLNVGAGAGYGELCQARPGAGALGVAIAVDTGPDLVLAGAVLSTDSKIPVRHRRIDAADACNGGGAVSPGGRRGPAPTGPLDGVNRACHGIEQRYNVAGVDGCGKPAHCRCRR